MWILCSFCNNTNSIKKLNTKETKKLKKLNTKETKKLKKTKYKRNKKRNYLLNWIIRCETKADASS